MSADATQEEAREYVQRIGVEYRFGCYKEKRADSCNLLAAYFEAIENKLDEAFKLFRDTCKRTDYNDASCFKYGRYVLNGMECDVDLDEARWAFDRACQKDNPPACRMKAVLDYKGTPKHPENLADAEKTMIKACRLEDADACFTLSGWFLGGVEAKPVGIRNIKHRKEIEKQFAEQKEKFLADFPRALEYALAACRLRHPFGCLNASRIYRRGDGGVPMDKAKAVHYLKEATTIVDEINHPHTPDFTG